ncbi:MAG: class I SAM-dependent methyltransferase [Sinobacteraceae bacterium]|nr:class I SAM-dependent methyltransferase [Nevskiaceae bacterium]
MGLNSDKSLVSNVSDTARWVAVYRAWESARPDALFHDPYADLLAGDRGKAIAALMPFPARNGWPLIARTKLIDELVLRAVAGGADCVINLAAGFDTRPYRLGLPPSLRWVEADLPALTDEKEAVLAQARPRCQLRRVKVDLADAAARSALLSDAVGDSLHALVVTEGLLLYLEDTQVRALSADLAAQPSIRQWILDLASPGVLEMLRKGMGAHLANAQMKFAPRKGVAYFEELGWEVAEVHSCLRAAARFRRLPAIMRLFAMLPEPHPRKLGKRPWSAVVLLGRST